MTDSSNFVSSASLLQDSLSLEDGSRWYGAYPAIVTNVVDPDGQGRVKVTLPWSPDSSGARYEQWARLATLMAGNGSGTFFIPNKDDEVLVVFQGGDPSFPFVIGALWNGKDAPPVSIAGPNVRRMIRSPGGVTIALDDSKGQETFTVELPNNRKLVLANRAESFLVKDEAGNSIHMTGNGVKITAGLKVEIDCSKAVINAGDLTVNAATATFSGIVKADSVVTNSIAAATYTPGAGNIL